MEKLNTGRDNLRKFGITMGLVFAAITLIFFIKHKHNTFIPLAVSLIFLAVGYFRPEILKLFYIFWMKAAFILAWVNTRIILIVLFYLVFAPAGIAMRILRVDLLDRGIDKNADTYWRGKEKEEFLHSNYERQF